MRTTHVLLAAAALSIATFTVKADVGDAGHPLAGNGRFVMGQLSNMRRDQYLLDTKTGRLWTVGGAEDEAAGTALFPVVYWTQTEQNPRGKALMTGRALLPPQ